MRRLATVMLLVALLSSMGIVLASEDRVEIGSETESIQLFPGRSVSFTVTLRSIEGEQDYNPSTNNPTTNPPTTTPAPTVDPPPPPSLPNIGIDSMITSLSKSSSMSMYSMLASSPQLTLRSEPPEGLDVEFETETLIVQYGVDYEVTVRVSALDSIEPGDYIVPITVRSNSWHYDTLEVPVTVLPYIDVVLNDVTVSDSLPEEGDDVVFTISATNYGEESTEEITCAIYNKDTNNRMASKQISLEANETKVFDVEWVAVEGAYNFRVFISSPENEIITTNNFFFFSLKVGPAFIPVDLGEKYFSEGLVYFESKKWQDAIDAFGLAIEEFQKEGRDNKVLTSQTYLEISEKYLEAHLLYSEGIEAMEGGNIELAKEKLHAAELIYTELGDIEKIDLCFNQIICLDDNEDDVVEQDASFLPYPWYTFTVPLLMIIVFLGYTVKPKNTRDLNGLLDELEQMYRAGQIREDVYIKEKYKIKLKMLEKYS